MQKLLEFKHYGMTWAVHSVASHEMSDLAAEEVVGLTRHHYRDILIGDWLPVDAQRHALLHELLHVAWEPVAAVNFGQDGSVAKEDVQEIVINALTFGAYAILADNRKLLEWLFPYVAKGEPILLPPFGGEEVWGTYEEPTEDAAEEPVEEDDDDDDIGTEEGAFTSSTITITNSLDRYGEHTVGVELDDGAGELPPMLEVMGMLEMARDTAYTIYRDRYGD